MIRYAVHHPLLFSNPIGIFSSPHACRPSWRPVPLPVKDAVPAIRVQDAPGMIDDPVTRIVTIIFRHAQDLSYQPGVFVPADQTRNLAVCGNTPFRYFLNNRKYLVYQILVYHAAPHSIFRTFDGNRAFFLTPSISTNLRFLSTPTESPVAYRGLRVAHVYDTSAAYPLFTGET